MKSADDTTLFTRLQDETSLTEYFLEKYRLNQLFKENMDLDVSNIKEFVFESRKKKNQANQKQMIHNNQ